MEHKIRTAELLKYQQIHFINWSNHYFIKEILQHKSTAKLILEKESKIIFGFILHLWMLKNIFCYGIQISGVLNVADVVSYGFDHYVTRR